MSQHGNFDLSGNTIWPPQASGFQLIFVHTQNVHLVRFARRNVERDFSVIFKHRANNGNVLE